jgi:hypothetical protein
LYVDIKKRGVRYCALTTLYVYTPTDLALALCSPWLGA